MLRNCGVRTTNTGQSKFVSSVMSPGWQDIPAECSQKVPKETINLSLSRSYTHGGWGGGREGVLRGGDELVFRGQGYAAQSRCTH